VAVVAEEVLQTVQAVVELEVIDPLSQANRLAEARLPNLSCL
tara:strand:- start:1069 stop:1194 length:126 start_codon:yes stop_codon:yes gene_type:complete